MGIALAMDVRGKQPQPAGLPRTRARQGLHQPAGTRHGPLGGTQISAFQRVV
jgi:hypothetical protein